jgi:hypothetical protein
MGRLILHVDREAFFAPLSNRAAIPNGAASGGGWATKRLLVTVQ